LTLCHSVIAKKDKSTNEIKLFSSIPDELAFLNFAKYCGYEYVGQDPKTDIQTILTADRELIYDLRFTFHFSAERKRMSVVVKNLQDGKYYLLTKGAEEVLIPRSKTCKSFSKEQLDETLDCYSKLGLRTMVLAYKELSEEDFEVATSRFINTESMSTVRRQEELDSIYEDLEQNLIIIGATAVEDQLQENVRDTIKCFSERGIKVWMLTGDKMETAINIAYSSSLIEEKDNLVTIKKVEDFYDEDLFNLFDKHKRGRFERHFLESSKICMAISGEVLWIIANEPQLKLKFCKVIEEIDLVIASRVTPGQKAELVKIVKENVKNSRTLAIGDGANDVNMIITADVGVAIYGQEGIQASRVADYSISEFQHLGPLIIHFGADMYRRNSDYSLYHFYKNILVGMPNI